MPFKILNYKSFKSSQYSFYNLIITISIQIPSFERFAFECEQETNYSIFKSKTSFSFKKYSKNDGGNSLHKKRVITRTALPRSTL